MISQAIDIAVDELGAQDALHFLATLIGKFTQRLPSRATLQKVKRAAADLSNPIVVRDFLVAESSMGRTVPPTILAGLGDGFGSNRDSIEPDILPAKLLAPLVAASSAFAGRVASAAKCEPGLWISRLQQAIETSDRKLLRKVRRHLCDFLDDPNHAPLISSLVAGATPGELANFAKRIGKTTGFSVPEFDKPIIEAVKDEAGLNVLRDAIAENFDSPAADRFLVSTFLLDGGDIAWIFGAKLDRLRLRRTLLRLLENVSDRSIQGLLGNAATRNRMIDVLTEDLSESAIQVARILMSVQTSIEEMLTLGRRLLAYLRNDYRQKLIAVLLQRSFAEAAPGDKRVAELIDEIGTEVDAVSVIRLAVPPNASSARLGNNIIVLASSRPEIRRSIVAQIDELSDRLVRSGQENLAEAAYIKWADLISEASPYYEAQLRASLTTLPFALRLVRLPVSKLIVSTFPCVYAELLKSKGEEDFKRIPALLSLPFSFFVDWDRAKAARRDLVDAFKKSSWPASDLLLTARAAGIENRILTRLLRTYGGERYIEDIERDARRIDLEQGSRILAVLQEFRLRQSDDDWD